MSWHVIWQRSASKNHLKAALKPIVGMNQGRKRPLIQTNDTRTGISEKADKDGE